MLILASKSPRRIALLREIGLEFSVCPSGVEEPEDCRLTPEELALEAALLKSREVLRAHPEDIVMGFDTVVSLDGQVFGKPHTPAAARETLRALRGKTHGVTTGVAVLGAARECSDAVSARVIMRDFSDYELDAYVRTGEPLDKAGAYGIQGEGSALVERYEGCYHTIVGLPILRTLAILRGFGIQTEGLRIPCACERIPPS